MANYSRRNGTESGPDFSFVDYDGAKIHEAQWRPVLPHQPHRRIVVVDVCHSQDTPAARRPRRLEASVLVRDGFQFLRSPSADLGHAEHCAVGLAAVWRLQAGHAEHGYRQSFAVRHAQDQRLVVSVVHRKLRYPEGLSIRWTRLEAETNMTAHRVPFLVLCRRIARTY